ncbi:MAG TPA: YciI family protein [Candidatus Acidoferrum sp.]|nr:YciI family protein [Candidatus Acidoferrum sp.]
MEYMLMIYVDEAGWPKLSQTQQEQGMAAYMAYTESLQKAGILKKNGRLHPSASATTVRAADGKPKVLDGPYADAKEQIGGFYIIDVPDREAALSWAARCPGASHGIVEVRQLWA